MTQLQASDPWLVFWAEHSSNLYHGLAVCYAFKHGIFGALLPSLLAAGDFYRLQLFLKKPCSIKCSDTISENFAFAIFMHNTVELVCLNETLGRRREDCVIFGFAP